MWGEEVVRPRKLNIVCTSYCGCGHCCGWEWGLTLPGNRYLVLGDLGSPRDTPAASVLTKPLLSQDRIRVKSRRTREDLRVTLFCRYWTATDLKGLPYTGVTSTGAYPKQARSAILSTSQLQNKAHRIPIRILLPWKTLPEVGTIAADTRFFSFGTKMLVPGYGWGIVQDHGSAIKGRLHVDLFHRSHQDALEWGHKELPVFIVPPGKHPLDAQALPDAVKPVAKALHNVWSLFFGLHH